ncbi:WD40 repeat domain-containing protein [Candidatus Daviesbacteria bacterium]|nr:WD40 repeat domain-containing protein [Candidatus Daviesbacteria bacterium]
MKLKKLIVLSLLLFSFFYSPESIFAEAKIDSSLGPPAGIIPKLPQTANDPELLNGRVYPNWGPPCQRYTYSVVYRDKEGRKPEYMKIYFNGKMIDMQKENQSDNDYKKGVKYIYKYVPNKIDSNFYYFEASNGLGKARASIIDSPDNGPVLFESAFDKNEIAVVDKQTGKKVLSFPTGKEWIGGVALSDDGKLLAVKTSQHVYLFDTSKPNKPLWQFNCEQCRIGEDVKGGVDISGDGSKIIAAFGEKVALFYKSSSKPIWIYSGGNSYNVAISKDGKYMAAATAGDEADLNANLIILWNGKSEKPLWQYHAAGNFHDVSLSDDGSFITGSTGCPDRRFYLFSKDSNKPIIRTEPLTRDSPVHRAKISADGMLTAVGSEADDGAVFLFSKDSKNPVWKFSTPQRSSVRALNFTPNGKYIGAATFGGDAYIFDKDKNSPIASWKVNASLGGIDIADDGSFIATGGTDSKLHIFDKNSKKEITIPFSEYIEEIDISANGKYIAAGTGGSVYFFETYISQDREQVFDCSKVIEPTSESQMIGGGSFGEPGQLSFWGRIVRFVKNLFVKSENSPPEQAFPKGEESVCGNDLCEPSLGETRENCPKDCTGED